MISPYDITLVVYNITIIPIIVFSVMFLVVTFLSLYLDRKDRSYADPVELPFVSIQIPTFNDPIAERCVRRCMEMDYPKDRYEIIIVDDSTNRQTRDLLKAFADNDPGFIKYIHRENREGFKPGALKNAMDITKGDILVVFDSDWIPNSDFLREVVKPFSDPRVAVVQTRQGFYNKDKNLITRLASYLLIAYHTMIMPIHNRANTVFFCGTAGALRRDAFDKVGGWNTQSLTEDSELTVRLLLEGYKTVYLKIETPSEVPETFESFIKQQMRWCYGNTRVFIDNARTILFSRKLTFAQKNMISYVTLGNITAPIVVIMTFFGFAGWFLGDPQLFKVTDLVSMLTKMLFTAGFLFMAYVALRKNKIARELPYLVASVFTVGIVLSVGNSYAFVKALFNRKLHWYCTPKADNSAVISK